MDLRSLLNELPPIPMLTSLIKGEKDKILDKKTNCYQHVTKTSGGLRKIRFNSSIGPILVLQQNPNTNSEFAALARKGEIVFWIIGDKVPKGVYIACFSNNQLVRETKWTHQLTAQLS